MNGQPVISVRGEASFEVEPEIAVVGVTVQARDRDRKTVLRLLADRNREVTGLIKGYGEAVEKLESGPVSVRPELKEKRAGERVAGYFATASVTVTIRDFTVLGELIVRLADAELATVDGFWWALRPGSPVYREARMAAARDATVRAGEYAEAFGGQLGDLLEAADSGLLTAQARQDSWRFSGPGAAAGRASGKAEPAQPELDLEPEKQTVSARVDARFEMIRPAGAHDHHHRQRDGHAGDDRRAAGGQPGARQEVPGGTGLRLACGAPGRGAPAAAGVLRTVGVAGGGPGAFRRPGLGTVRQDRHRARRLASRPGTVHRHSREHFINSMVAAFYLFYGFTRYNY